MTNSQKTIKFFNLVDEKIKQDILENIAKQYQITTEDAYDEVTDEEAEHLLDYITGSKRMSYYELMKEKQCY